MTYEVPTTGKRTPVVKEDDNTDSPLQVSHSAHLSGRSLLLFSQMVSIN